MANLESIVNKHKKVTLLYMHFIVHLTQTDKDEEEKKHKPRLEEEEGSELVQSCK
jgi:hypothetical protein